MRRTTSIEVSCEIQSHYLTEHYQEPAPSMHRYIPPAAVLAPRVIAGKQKVLQAAVAESSHSFAGVVGNVEPEPELEIERQC